MSTEWGTIARRWWRQLQPRPDGGGGDRAALARLRRCATVMDAAMEPATLQLCRALRRDHTALEQVAVAAAVLAHVREDLKGGAARQLGAAGAAKRPVMSPLRFRRLIQARTGDERLAAFRRAVALAGGAMDAADLGGSLLRWDDRQRQRWLYAYYDAPDEWLAPDESNEAERDSAT